MCGIVGYVNYSSQEAPNINKMLSSIKHRGPDAQNFQCYDIENIEVVLGHVRLSILDLSHAAEQPMSDNQNRYHIVYNGEVYNFQEIKEELAEYQFLTNSDSEVVLYAYKKWGVECANKFIGMFSIVILDRVTNELIFINDRLGVKPLYIYQDDKIIIFSSELKGILQYSGVKRDINKKALTQFMQYGYIQPPLSIFNDVRKIEPGTIISISLLEKKQKQKRYWSVEDSIWGPNKLNIDKLEDTLLKAFQYRMVADVPVCSFLSSGVDSSLVTSLLAAGSKLNTITIGMDDVRYNEADLARNIAHELKTKHVEQYISEYQLQQLVETLPFYYDEPFSDVSMYPTYLVSKIAVKNGFKVALSSDGGDEAFGGYYRYLFFKKYYKFLFRVPKCIKILLAYILKLAEKTRILNRLNIQMISLKIQKILNSLEADNVGEFYENLNKYISDDKVKKLLNDASLEKGHFNNFTILHEKYKADVLNVAMAIDYNTYIYQNLTRLDRSSMANSLEVREPLLDHSIIELALNLESRYKLEKNNTKLPLKEVLGKYLDLNFLTKKKKGFSIPIETWLRGDLKDLVEKHTSKKAIEKSGVFDFSVVEKIKTDFYHNNSSYIELWHVFIFQLWYQQWGEGLYLND